MPVGTLPATLTILSAAGIPLAATAAINPAPDSYTLLGAAFAVFCIVAYIRMKQPQTGVWALLFNAVATLGVGWILPEPFAQYILRSPDLSNKGWSALALFLGLGGGALVTSAIVAFRKRIPAAIEKAADKFGIPHGEPGADERDDDDEDPVAKPPAA